LSEKQWLPGGNEVNEIQISRQNLKKYIMSKFEKYSFLALFRRGFHESGE